MAEEVDKHGEAIGAALSKVLPQVSRRQVVHRSSTILRVRPVKHSW
jgi:hypothetical protein